MKLENKVALITGAASGIGRATAVVAAQEGANVVVVDINDKGGSETVQIIKKAGGRAVFRHLDVTREDEIRPAILDIVREQGRIDFLHNNAGAWDLNMGDTLEKTTLEQWMHWINLDLTSLYLVSKHVVEDMKKRKAGAIVNTSSINAYYAYPGELAYASAKAGVIGFTKSMAIDWGRYNIRVNAVCPGEILTPAARDTFNRMPDPKAAMEAMKRQIPLRRFAEPEEVGKAVVWLGCDEASFINGTTLVIDGGQTAGVAPARD